MLKFEYATNNFLVILIEIYRLSDKLIENWWHMLWWERYDSYIIFKMTYTYRYITYNIFIYIYEKVLFEIISNLYWNGSAQWRQMSKVNFRKNRQSRTNDLFVVSFSHPRPTYSFVHKVFLLLSFTKKRKKNANTVCLATHRRHFSRLHQAARHKHKHKDDGDNDDDENTVPTKTVNFFFFSNILFGHQPSQKPCKISDRKKDMRPATTKKKPFLKRCRPFEYNKSFCCAQWHVRRLPRDGYEVFSLVCEEATRANSSCILTNRPIQARRQQHCVDWFARWKLVWMNWLEAEMHGRKENFLYM